MGEVGRVRRSRLMVEGLLERGVAGAWLKGGVRTKNASPQTDY